MLTLYRSNRAEFLAALLARQLKEECPGPMETVEVMVNTWPTSRWLGEQLAAANGISSLVRFPFPGSRLRQLVRLVLQLPAEEDDPWRAGRLVWVVLDQLPALLREPQAAPLQRWLERREASVETLSRDRWQLARSIADALDDYALYRPDTLTAWRHGDLRAQADWQPLLWRRLAEVLPREPFGLQVREAVQRLREGTVRREDLPRRLRLFGISALAPVQVELIQALSGWVDVEIYLLTPCRDLWQRCGSRRLELGADWLEPPDGTWLEKAPRMEATLGRMGAEFQQLLEGSGETQLGEVRTGDLFADGVSIAAACNRPPTLLEQLQTQLAEAETTDAESQATTLTRSPNDQSLLFQSAPGPWREVQLVRDRILQWLASDPELEPRDVLVMTPQIDRAAPLLASVFNDRGATGVDLPWRLTDRSQQSSPGLSMAMLDLLQLAGGRLTASGLERLLANPAVQRQQGLSAEESALLTATLQRSGFRWGLDADERGGDPTHSLRWCLDRWLLGLVLPDQRGLAPGGVAPFHQDLDPDRLARWWSLLDRLGGWIAQLRRPQPCAGWVEQLQRLLKDLFGNGGAWEREGQSWLAALEEWRRRAETCELDLEASVVFEVLSEALSVDSGRFGHRSGALTVSALEPMRAIPHKVIVLMGLDGRDFPRQSNRPGFHLLEQQRQLGDPRGGDQDRYVLLEALMSARQHLLISWCGRSERTGEELPPAAPVDQWLRSLRSQLSPEQAEGLLLTPPPSPLDRANFQIEAPLSCDRRQLAARLCLDQPRPPAPEGLALPLVWDPPEPPDPPEPTALPVEELLRWMIQPQAAWLRHRRLHPGEGVEPVRDLDDLELDALQRHGLLEESLDLQLLGRDRPDWCRDLEGRGVLPAAAGAALEQQELLDRWAALAAQIEPFGPCRREQRQLAGTAVPLLYAGDTQVVVQVGRPGARGVMRAWLQHLLLCAADDPPMGSGVVGRSSTKAGAELLLLWDPLSVEEALTILSDLQRLAQEGLSQCWPVPPKSGWQMVWQEQRRCGSGEQAFRQTWLDERDSPAMQLCFGVESDPALLLQAPGFENASRQLYEPILRARRT